jgi:hypothetical protein
LILTLVISALAVSALSALTVSALAVGLLALVALARLIALVLNYWWSDIVEQLGKGVRIWRGMIVTVTRRVAGVTRQAALIVVLSEGCTASKTIVSFPAPTQQDKG